MQIEFTTKKKLEAVLAQIRQLLLSDFPHDASRSALSKLQTYFEGQEGRLKRAVHSGNPAILAQTCGTVNERIAEFLPVLGLLLRSTNVRNSFECYDGLLQIAQALIGADAQVILSSEWEMSPLTYPMSVSALPEYVLLGMPASEASNALILPLAGHELGHSCWINEALEAKHRPALEQSARTYLKTRWNDFVQAFPEHVSITPTDSELTANMFLVDVIALVTRLACDQIEEIFCDAVGMNLFGRSYAYSFHYLLAPSLGGERSRHYPPLRQRAKYIADFGSENMNDLGFAQYEMEFSDNSPRMGPRDKFCSQSADFIANEMAENMFREASQIVKARGAIHVPNQDAEAEILASFMKGIPARRPGSLPAILNAGWDYVVAKRDHFDESERPLFEWVSELALKSMEVLEFWRRVQHA